jgi:GTP-binding protein
VYGGQIVGLHARGNDIVVNPSKAKKLTNIRTTAADEKLFLTPPLSLTLEAALELINEDELVEVTPKSIRLRKRILDHNERKRVEKARDQGLEG